MRTKTLLLSAALGALSSASLMAQVYSLNAVGYINVTCPVGFTQIADQLYATNGVPNYISPTLDAQLGTNSVFQKCYLYKFYNSDAGSGFLTYEVTAGSQSGYASSGTSPLVAKNGSPAPSTVTMNPGEAWWFYNPGGAAQSGGPVTLTFIGTVPTTNATLVGLTNILSAGNAGTGLQTASSIVPVAGQVDTVLGVHPNTGDYVYTFNPTNQEYSTWKWTAGGSWSPKLNAAAGSAPVVGVGQGFWYYVNAVNSTNAWVQYFGVSQ